jgi:hypothetical protein
MERIKVHPGERTPKVLFDGNKGILNIRGRSIPEDTKDFYKVILDGIDEYAKDPASLLSVTIDLEFFNTSSARELLKIFKKLDKEEFKSEILWVYEEGDEDMEEAGRDYNDMVRTIEFEFIEIPEEKE